MGACPAPNLSFSGATRPAPPIPGASPAPNPGVLFPRRKSTQKGAGETPDPLLLFNRTLSNLDGALPLNQRILRGSDLWRTARPASPDGLLKGQMNLFVSLTAKCLSSRGPTGEVRQPPHRLRGASGKKEFQWLRSALLQASDWAKRGPGCPRRRFHPPAGGRLRGQPPHSGGS